MCIKRDERYSWICILPVFSVSHAARYAICSAFCRSTYHSSAIASRLRSPFGGLLAVLLRAQRQEPFLRVTVFGAFLNAVVVAVVSKHGELWAVAASALAVSFVGLAFTVWLYGCFQVEVRAHKLTLKIDHGLQLSFLPSTVCIYWGVRSQVHWLRLSLVWKF